MDQHRFSQKAFVLLLLLSLLLQVQSVFACQMMERSGNVADCCCDDEPENKPDCCDYSSELALKALPDEVEEALATQLNQLSELSSPVFITLLFSLWSIEPQPILALIAWDFDHDPGDPGSATYLSTLRLRI